jgi:hypothetical protein
MLINDALAGVQMRSIRKNRPYTRMLLECGEWHEGCKAFHEGRVGDAHSD